VQITKVDSEIQMDVLEELRWDSRVRPAELGVDVKEGIVVLSGRVDSYARKLAAREAAHRVVGVLDVADEIEVVVPAEGTPSDAEIAEAARSALTWSVFVPHERIQTTVSDGWITLDGEVERGSERTDAEEAAQHLQGVRGVTNLIRIASRHLDTGVIRTAIEQALERRAEREARHLDVQVDGGSVTLSGTVHDWSEGQAIVRTASHAPGVYAVKNELRIDLFGR